MPQIALDLPAPNFKLEDFEGEHIQLSDFKNLANVLLVFNRGFT